ncbi:ATP-binding protein [Phytopseudomonas flavescens]|uniref:ATP-binding protein n=1 Tax=Phytopseudomonas flavescens TaxID=29435 RepID=UPI001FC95A43|nr:ATP-binding protein [Pseudomonas flavescens]
MACRRRGSTLTVQLHDRGPGIAAEHLPHLFEEFYRVREARDRDVEGIGLGLSIVKRIAALLDLQITFASRVGHGTSITLSGLPVVKASAMPSTLPTVAPAQRLEGVHVLLIDDDSSVLEAMARLLRSWGCTVTALDGPPSEALSCDVVVTDFDLGREATGVECLAQLEKWQGRSLPALILTGHDLDKIRSALPDPRIPLLSKPVRSGDLQKVIAELAGRPVGPSPG